MKRFCDEDSLHSQISEMEQSIYNLNEYYINKGCMPWGRYKGVSRAKAIRQIIEVRDKLNSIRDMMEHPYETKN